MLNRWSVFNAVPKFREQRGAEKDGRRKGEEEIAALPGNYTGNLPSALRLSAMQSGSPDALGATAGQTAPTKKIVKPAVHRFWDTENILLFAGVGAARGLDYASTLNIRRRGINEAFLTNAIVDDHAEFAAIEVAADGDMRRLEFSYIFRMRRDIIGWRGGFRTCTLELQLEERSGTIR